MTPSEFKAGMNELAEFYGEKAFSPNATAIMFRMLSPLSSVEFRRVIEQLLFEHARAPSLASVKKTALPMLRDAELRKQRAEIDRLEAMGNRCLSCDHTGYIIALLRSDPTKEYAFRCPSCTASKARRLDDRIPEWENELKAAYIPVSLRMDSYVAASRLQRSEFDKTLPKGARVHPAASDLVAFGEALLANARATRKRDMAPGDADA